MENDLKFYFLLRVAQRNSQNAWKTGFRENRIKNAYELHQFIEDLSAIWLHQKIVSSRRQPRVINIEFTIHSIFIIIQMYINSCNSRTVS